MQNDYQELHSVILFDGLCNLCSSSVLFVIRRDKYKHFRFASLQGEFGKKILHQYGLNDTHLNSFILLEHNTITTASTAALRVAKKLTFPWPVFYGLIIIPAWLRNGIYHFFARNRYNWFGRKKECWIPDTDISFLFLK